jgi:hypothetical protein
VGDHAGEQREDEPDAVEHRRQALAPVPVHQGDPRDHHEEGRVHVDIDAGDAGELP